MKYDAVLHYSDEEQRGYARFFLPPNPPANPVNEAVHVVHRNAAEHPKYSRDLTNVFDYRTGRGIRLYTAGEVAKPATEKYKITKRLSLLKIQQKKAPWRRHHSFSNGNRGRCCWIPF